MRKADLLDELRAEIGTISDSCKEDLTILYDSLCQILCERVSDYQSVQIYFSRDTAFEVAYSAGNPVSEEPVPYGDGIQSIAAARGGLAVERVDSITEVCVPFYRGHHLLGQIVMTSFPDAIIDDEDLTFFCELGSLLETKAKECN